MTFSVFCTAARKAKIEPLGGKKAEVEEEEESEEESEEEEETKDDKVKRDPSPGDITDPKSIAEQEAEVKRKAEEKLEKKRLAKEEKEKAKAAKAKAEAEAKLQMQAEAEAEQKRIEEALGDGTGRGRYLLGRCTVSLRRMLTELYEPLTEPLDLLDPSGELCGMLNVSLLARDALQRARRSALKGPGTVELWVGGESLLLAPSLRAAAGIAAVWVEAHLEVEHVAPARAPTAGSATEVNHTPTLSVASRRVRVPRGAPAGGLPTLSMQLRGCLTLPAGSSARAGLQRAVKRGGADAAISFFLFSTTADASSSERLSLAAARVTVAELLEKAGGGKAAAAAGGADEGADGVPLQLSLRDARGELLGTLSADIEGLNALRQLKVDTKGKHESPQERQWALNRAAIRGDPEGVQAALGLGADVRAADAWGQTPLHWAASAPPVDDKAAALDVCLRAGGTVHARNTVGMTPLHWASAWGRLPAARSLLWAGADRDAMDVRKSSPAALVHQVTVESRVGVGVGASADAESKVEMLKTLKGSRMTGMTSGKATPVKSTPIRGR